MRLTVLTGLLLLGAAWVAQADDDWAMLRKVAQSGRQQALTGTYLHQMNGALETFRIVRGMQGDAVQEKRWALDGPSREIVRSGVDLACFAPDKRALMAAKVSAMRLFPALLPDEMADIAQSYTIRKNGADRVAQRDCNWLELKPRDKQRYSMKLCVEPGSALPLKVMTVNNRGETVEQFAFTEVDLTAPKDKSVYRPRYKQSYVLRNASMQPLPADVAASSGVSGLPQGFRLLRAVQRNLPGQTDKSVHHLVYSDGLVMMSLFVEPAADNRADKVINLHGAINMASRHDGGGHQLTLVGDMPPPAIVNMLKNLRVSLH